MNRTGVVDSRELAQVLSSTRLAGRPVREIGGRTLAVDCAADEVWQVWSAARSVVHQTGRWPVVVTTFSKGVDPWTASVNTDDSSASALVEASRTVDPWTTFVHGSTGLPLDADSLRWIIEDDAHLTDADAPVLLGAGATVFDVERLKLNRRLAAAGSVDRLAADAGRTAGDRPWFTPTGQPCAVVFLPVPTSWEAAARVSYYGADDPERHAALVAAAREWGSRYGAELVASWTTMLQLVVTAPPVSLEDAWQLAGQQLAVGGSLQTDRSDLTIALLRADAWFLHDRP